MYVLYLSFTSIVEGVIRHEKNNPSETTVLTSGHAVPPANDVLTRHHLNIINKDRDLHVCVHNLET